VLHYELPNSAQAYAHRAGRTGRAGQQGTSVALVLDRERGFLKRHARELGIEVEGFVAAEPPHDGDTSP